MYDSNQLKIVSNILKKNKTNYWTGEECKKFEKEFSEYHKTKYSIAVSNGSVALEIALKSLNLKVNDKVIVTPRSFVISASCVLNAGLQPVFADVDNNGTLKINGISEAYSRQVKAIILVHLNGLSCDMRPILNFVKKKKLFLIEDCSQAHGAVYKNKKVGSFGDVAIWSFCQDKIISTGGEGGMLSTNSKKIWKKCWSIKDHGKNYSKILKNKKINKFNWVHDELGSNYRMTEMQAALGRYQLKKLDKSLKKREKIAMYYIESLKEYFAKYSFFEKLDYKCNDCPLSFKNCNSCKHSFYRLNIFVNLKKINKLKLIKNLNKIGVNCFEGSCPEIYLEKVFKNINNLRNLRLKNAKKLGKSSLTFKINPNKNFNQIRDDVIKIKKILNKLI